MPQGKSWLSAGIRKGLCSSCTPPPNSRCYTLTAGWAHRKMCKYYPCSQISCLNWCLLSPPVPLYTVIRSSSMLCLRAALRWHLVTTHHLPAWSVSTYPTTWSRLVHTWWPWDEVACYSCGLDLLCILDFRLVLKQKLLRAGIIITFPVSLKNIADIQLYYKIFNTFRFALFPLNDVSWSSQRARFYF